MVINQHSCGCLRKPRRVNARRGFTLMEVLLVMAILIAMVAMAWPALMDSLETDALRRSGDKLRSVLAGARVRAMQNGVIHAFRYEPETGTYVVEPWQDDYSEVNATDPTQLLVQTQPDLMGGAAQNDQPLEQNANAEELYEGVTFSVVESQYSSRALALLAETSADQVIFFYPDGTATAATVRIQIGSVENQDDVYLEVTLNGMTGLTKKSDLLLPDEIGGVSQ